jgi:predicted nucleotidyltransferase
MIMQALYPEPDRNVRLLDELETFFAGLPAVRRVLVFGSFGRGKIDRWSDIDMLLVTADPTQFGPVFAVLARHKPIRYRGTFTPQVEQGGGRVLGIVFEDESVFHCLDLNFLGEADYLAPGALDRFRHLQERWVNAGPLIADGQGPVLAAEEENPDEYRLAAALHFTKKAIKQILRRGKGHAGLARRVDALRLALSECPVRKVTPRGDIQYMARLYLSMAEVLLSDV